MLVGGEENPLPVLPLVGKVSQHAQAEQIGGPVQREALLGRQALARRHLLGQGK
jgi:hypothetical protein